MHSSSLLVHYNFFLVYADEDVTGGKVYVSLHWWIFRVLNKQIDLCKVLKPCLLKAGTGSFYITEEIPGGIPSVSV